MTEQNLETLTVNDVPVTNLSPAGQKIFGKVVALKKECEDLEAQFNKKQLVIKELADMIIEEVNEYKLNQQTTSDPSSNS